MSQYVRETPWPFREHPAFGDARIVDRAEGRVELVPSRTCVAIMGFADSCRELAPFDDPAWEIWGLNQLARYIPRAERWFEIHHRKMFEADIARGTDYIGWLRYCPIPVYMLDAEPEFASSVRYPIERIVHHFGREYLTSTPAYMLALAILEGFERIGIYGVDLIVGREYAFEKPCLEYWCGQAEARGIALEIPYPQSALLKQGVRYGLPAADVEASGRLGPSQVLVLHRQLEAKLLEINKAMAECAGALQATRTLLEADEVLQRGGTLPGFQV